MTVAELCDRYMEAADKGLIMGKGGMPKTASTIRNDRSRIDCHIKPLLGRKLVIDLTRQDVSGFVRDVTEGRTAMKAPGRRLRGAINVTGGRGTAARAKGFLGALLTYATDLNVIERNPAAGVKTAADGVRHRRFSDEELQSVGEVIRQLDAEHWQALAFIRLTFLTGWRKSEIEGLVWGAVNSGRSTAIIDRSKEGRSIRPLGRPVVELLAQLPRKGLYVLPGIRSRDGHFAAGYNAFIRVCEAAQVLDVSPHTARHTLITKAQEELGISESIAGAVVGHRKSMTVTGLNYTHFAPEFLVGAATAITSEVARIMGFDDLLPPKDGDALQA